MVYIPQAEVVLQHALDAQRVEVKRTRKRLRVGAHGLREEDQGVAPGDVEAGEHGVGEDVECDLPPVVR